MSKRKSYEQNPTQNEDMAIGAGLGVLLGGVLLGFPGALVGGGVGAVIGSTYGTPHRRALDNPRCSRGTQVQKLIFSRGRFSRNEAVTWARRNGFRGDEKSFALETNKNNHVIRLESPSRFTRDSFRTITLTDGVKAVIGCPRA